MIPQVKFEPIKREDISAKGKATRFEPLKDVSLDLQMPIRQMSEAERLQYVAKQKARSYLIYRYLGTDPHAWYDKLVSLPKSDIEYITDAVMHDPQSFDEQAHRIVSREYLVRQLIDEYLASSKDIQDATYVIMSDANIWGAPAALSRYGYLHKIGLETPGYSDAAYEAVCRIIAARPFSFDKMVLQAGATIPKVLLEFWMLPFKFRLGFIKEYPKLRAAVATGLKFATREAMQAPQEGETIGDRIERASNAFVYGGFVGGTHAYIPSVAIRAPISVGGATLITGLYGGSTEDMIQTASTVAGFELYNALQQYSAGQPYRGVGPVKQNPWLLKPIDAIRAAASHGNRDALIALSYKEARDLAGRPITQIGRVAAAYRPSELVGPKAKALSKLPPAQPPLRTQPHRILTAQPTQLATIDSYLVEHSKVTGFPQLPRNPDIIGWRFMTLRSMKRTQQRFAKRYKAKLTKTDRPNMLNPWVSSRHMFATLEERTGKPFYTINDRMIRAAGHAERLAFNTFTNKISIADVSRLTPKDNIDIAKWLWSPKTRAQVQKTISPHAQTIALKLQDILQGPAAREVQESVFRLWSKTGKPPRDIWRYAADSVTSKYFVAEPRLKRGADQIAMRIIRKGYNPKRVNAHINRVAKLEGWSSMDKEIIAKVFHRQSVNDELRAARKFPAAVLSATQQAKDRGTLKQFIANSYPWNKGLGIRKFYYMSDPASRDVIDDYLSRVSKYAIDKPAQSPHRTPGTIPYEAHARLGEAKLKKGSVVNNVLTHYQRVSIANAVADDIDLMYKYLNEANLSNTDFAYVRNMINNLLMKRPTITQPAKVAIDIKRWFWRTRLSIMSRPDAALWMAFRNSMQNFGMGPTAINLKEAAKAHARIGKQLLRGRTLSEIDPEMMKRFHRDFPTYVSQRRAFYREYLMQDTANMSREFGNKYLAGRYATLLERTGSLYGWVDEYGNRMPLWITQYQIAKHNAKAYLSNKITRKQFLVRTNVATMRDAQKIVIQDLLGAGRIDDAAAEIANITVDDVHLRYTTPSRAMVEQTPMQRVVMGIYTFPRGAAELLAYRGVYPMMKGIETKNWTMARTGTANLLKSMAAGTIVCGVMTKMVGRGAYDLASHSKYTLLGPGAGTVQHLFDANYRAWSRYARKEISFAEAVDSLLSAFSNNVEEFFPMARAFENAIESAGDIKGLSAYRALKAAVQGRLVSDKAGWKKAERTGYQKIMHLFGGFESVPEEGDIYGRTKRAREPRPSRSRR